MIRSRPGFSQQIIDDAKPGNAKPAKLNRDMEPAFAHSSRATPTASTLKQAEAPDVALKLTMQAKADEAFRRMQEKANTLRGGGPELILNPAVSPPPHITSPHK